MKVGLMFVNSGPFSQPELLAQLAVSAEQCGVESLWTVEHVVIPQGYQSPYPYAKDGKIPGGEDVAIPDPLLPLSYVAALTTKVKLATGVMILPQRNPLYVAKEMATLDLLSHGRTILGIGSGWLKEEFDALGLDFHVRGARTDEAIEALRAVWNDNPSSFHGKHFNFGPLMSFPKPAQKGGIPVHVGGHSPAAARRAGRLGDGFFPAIADAAKLKELFGLMRDEAHKHGRNADAIELSCMGRANVDTIKAFADLGITRVVVPPPGFDKEKLTRGLEKLANEIIAKV
ncbi:MAG: LLM class F420-dependent oxidoreductase [Candidatus Binataceae bacterium]|nr:LLM class F420-dependent oxidoreductase [Candidatus Binataceae bacterium]